MATDLTNGKKVAVKRVSLLQKKLQEAYTLNKLNLEIELMQKLNHPNIVKYHDVIKKETEWYIVMEYCNAGTLDDVIRFNEEMNKNKILSFIVKQIHITILTN